MNSISLFKATGNFKQAFKETINGHIYKISVCLSGKI